jgi:carbon-monoxide dehydrogenase medium subunit
MKPVVFDYERPRDLGAALDLLRQAEGEGKLLAGGQSLGPMLNLRLVQPALLVDLAGIAELKAVEAGRDGVRLGALVTHAAIEDGAVPDPTRGFLRFIAAGIAYRAVRNRGTIGGSLAHADPAADWVSALALLGASALVVSADGERHVPVADLVEGAFQTVLGDGDVLCAVDIPALSPGARWAYVKLCRKPGEFAQAIGAALLDPERGVERAVIGATAGAPIVLDDGRDAEAALARFDPIERRLYRAALRRARAELTQ